MDPRLLWRTVRHLTGRQIVYQVLNRLRSRTAIQLPETVPAAYFLAVPPAEKPVSFDADAFTFLNRTMSFKQDIDWNYPDFGKLWTYNLNYFDFLNQPYLAPETGIVLIRDFMGKTALLTDGLEPYPTSLRIINWVYFLSRNQIHNQDINRHLFAQTTMLRRRIEYNLGGNHLLENGSALLTASLYFRQPDWLVKAQELLFNELKAQILADGCHAERSPMYHQILLDRLLDTCVITADDSWHKKSSFSNFLTGKARHMLNWLETVTFRNGDVPMVNDAAPGIGPDTGQLRLKADRVLGSIPPSPERPPVTVPAQTTDSGYRMFRNARFELFADAGPVGPDHQPGHAHADTFSFVLYVDNQPIIVDTGTSTYQLGNRRSWERSTAAHNTVEVGSINSSEVWAGFRVGRRAQTVISEDTETGLTACHDGYRHKGVLHERSWQIESGSIRIVDSLMTQDRRISKQVSGVARLFFHAGVSVVIHDDCIIAGPVRLTFTADEPPVIELASYQLADGFNKYQPAQCLSIGFFGTLTSTFTPTG